MLAIQGAGKLLPPEPPSRGPKRLTLAQLILAAGPESFSGPLLLYLSGKEVFVT